MDRSSSRRLARCLGIDFGTSTSVLCYKDYHENWQDFSDIQTPPIDSESRSLKHLVPTAIFVTRSGRRFYGSSAEHKSHTEKGQLFRNFKMDLVGADRAKRHQAEELLDDFFRFLYQRYKESQQKSAEHELVAEHTYVSYPAKWPDAVRQRTLEAAEKAGFPEVKGIDEPTAAMQYTLMTHTTQTEELVRRGIIQQGVSLRVLLLDMGAGTTDLVLYKYRPGSPKQEVLMTWPPVDNHGTFGGREVDGLLGTWLLRWLKKEYGSGDFPNWEHVLESQPLEVRNWKESISRALRHEDPVDVPPDLLVMFSKMNPRLDTHGFPSVSKRLVCESLKDYLPTFPRLVGELLERAIEAKAIRDGRDIDLVVLTGGHSQWFFTREMLLGGWVPGLPGSPEDGSGIRFRKIQHEQERLIEFPVPQEVVARGLALMGKRLEIIKKAANNHWFKLQVSVSDPITIPMVAFGERLPIKNKFVFRRIDARYKPARSVDVRWTPLYGAKLETAIPFDSKCTRLETQGFFEEMLVDIAGMFLDEVPDTADVCFEVSVDETEHLTAIGLVKGGEPFQDIKYFSINREAPSDEERAELTRQYKKQSAMIAPVSGS